MVTKHGNVQIGVIALLAILHCSDGCILPNWSPSYTCVFHYLTTERSARDSLLIQSMRHCGQTIMVSRLDERLVKDSTCLVAVFSVVDSPWNPRRMDKVFHGKLMSLQSLLLTNHLYLRYVSFSRLKQTSCQEENIAG